MSVGILALQGGYEAHAQQLSKLGVAWHYVRETKDLNEAQGLILPGGESSTCLKLLQEKCLFNAIKTAGKQGLPMFGTCAGAILLAKYVFAPIQPSLELVDITIQRNAYGRQLASRITTGYCHLTQAQLPLVFIRAPRINTIADSVEIVVSCDKDPVCIRQKHYLVATFHPELTEDTTLHHYFIENMVLGSAKTLGAND